MTGRQRVSLTGPPDGSAPIPTIARPAEAWRAHRLRTDTSAGAWWYASTLDGRFDLQPPKGTCYLASDATSALRERLGPTLSGLSSVEAADVEGVAVSRLPVPRGRALADVIAADAVHLPGLTRELCTVIDYELTRAWAAWFDKHGCGGIRYSTRHTTALDSLSYALFGKAGTRSTRPRETLDARKITAAAGLQIVSDAIPDADIDVITQPERRRRIRA